MRATGRNPTLKEKKLMDTHDFNPDYYLVVKSTPSELVIINKHRGTTETIKKAQ